MHNHDAKCTKSSKNTEESDVCKKAGNGHKKREEEVMSTNSNTVSRRKEAEGGGLHNTLVYIRQHWQLYLIFLMPALLLTLIFKYAPMSGILIAFQDYNPFKGVMGSK